MRRPIKHWLAELPHLRAVGPGVKLDDIFLHRAVRKVRLDGTVQLHGAHFEVRAELVGRSVELRYDPCDPDALPRVFLCGTYDSDAARLDLHRNAHRRRRQNLTPELGVVEPTGIDPLEQIAREHYDRVCPDFDVDGLSSFEEGE